MFYYKGGGFMMRCPDLAIHQKGVPRFGQPSEGGTEILSNTIYQKTLNSSNKAIENI